MTVSAITQHYDGGDTTIGTIPNSVEGIVAQILRGSAKVTTGKLVFTDTPTANPIVAFDAGTSQIDAVCSIGAAGGDCLYFRIQDANNWWRLRLRSIGTQQTYQYANGTYTYGAWQGPVATCYQPGDDAYAPGNHYYPSGDPATATNWVSTTSTVCNETGHFGWSYTRTATPNYSTGTRTVITYSLELELCTAGVITSELSIPVSSAVGSLHVLNVGNVISVISSSSTVLGSKEDDAFNTATLVGQGLGGPSYAYGSALDDLVVTPQVYDPQAPTLVKPLNNSYVDLLVAPTFTMHYNNKNPADYPIARRARRKVVDGDYEYEQADGTFGVAETDIVVAHTSSLDISKTYADSIWDNVTYSWAWAFKGHDTDDWGPYATDAVVVGNAVPTLEILAPYGVISDTDVPTVTLSYSDDDGDPMVMLQVKIFTDAIVAASDFSPDASATVWDSGRLNTDEEVLVVGMSLPNKATYWVYAQAWQVGGLTSGWVSSQFGINVSAPGTPSIDATYSSDVYGTNLTIQGHDNLASATLASAEDGNAWSNTSNCAVEVDASQALSGSQSVKVSVINAGDAVITSEEIDVVNLAALETAMASVLGSVVPTTVELAAECFDSSGNLLQEIVVDTEQEQFGSAPPPIITNDASLVYSLSSDRSNPDSLDGASVTTDIYVQTIGDNLFSVTFYLDSTTVIHTTENNPPYDFNGSTLNNGQDLALPLTIASLSEGSHTITARVIFVDGSVQTLSATFGVAINVASAPTGVVATSTTAGKIDVTWTPPTDDGGSAITGYKLVAAPVSGSIVGTATVGAVTSGSIAGVTSGQQYNVTVASLNANGVGTASAPVTVTVASPTSGTNFLLIPSAYGYPDATNTGYVNYFDPTLGRKLTKSDLTQVGGFTTTAENQVFTRLHIVGKVKVAHAGVRFIGCLFEYGGLNAYTLSDHDADKAGTLHGAWYVSYCTFVGPVPSTGLLAHLNPTYAKIDHCDISGGTDGMDPYGPQGLEFHDNYIHDLTPYQGGHSDCIQLVSGDATIYHNTLISCNPSYPIGAFAGGDTSVFPGNTSGLQLGQLTGTLRDVHFYDNLCDGGNDMFNANWSSDTPDSTGATHIQDPSTSVYIQNNRFGRDERYGLHIHIPEGHNFVITTNVWDDDGSPAWG